MFWSKYNILSKSNKYGYLLFNTMSLAFIKILENDINTWLELKENPDSYKDFCNSNFLLKARIIVENQEDDLNVYLADILKIGITHRIWRLPFCQPEDVISDVYIVMSKIVQILLCRNRLKMQLSVL